jgi:hypothetical protein
MYVTATVMRAAVPPAVPDTRSTKSPDSREVFCRVALQVVAPSRDVVPPVFEHARPPAAAVARAEETRFVIVPR